MPPTWLGQQRQLRIYRPASTLLVNRAPGLPIVVQPSSLCFFSPPLLSFLCSLPLRAWGSLWAKPCAACQVSSLPSSHFFEQSFADQYWKLQLEKKNVLKIQNLSPREILSYRGVKPSNCSSSSLLQSDRAFWRKAIENGPSSAPRQFLDHQAPQACVTAPARVYWNPLPCHCLQLHHILCCSPEYFVLKLLTLSMARVCPWSASVPTSVELSCFIVSCSRFFLSPQPGSLCQVSLGGKPNGSEETQFFAIRESCFFSYWFW